MQIAEVSACIWIFSVSDVFDGDGIQETKHKLQHLLTGDNAADSVEGSHRSVYLMVYYLTYSLVHFREILIYLVFPNSAF